MEVGLEVPVSHSRSRGTQIYKTYTMIIQSVALNAHILNSTCEVIMNSLGGARNRVTLRTYTM